MNKITHVPRAVMRAVILVCVLTVTLFSVAMVPSYVLPSAHAQTTDIDNNTGSKASAILSQFQGFGGSIDDLKKGLKLPDGATNNDLMDMLNGPLGDAIIAGTANVKDKNEFLDVVKNESKKSSETSNEKAPTQDQSFYRMQSAVSGYYGAVLGAAGAAETNEEASKKSKLGAWSDIMNSFGNAGGFVGFCDSKIMEGCTNWLSGSGDTTNSMTYAYDSLESRLTAAYNESPDREKYAKINLETGDARKTIAKSMYEYSVFGGTLSMLGIDDVIKSGNRSSMEQMQGAVSLFVFVASAGIDRIFDFTLQALQFMNPFGVFVPSGSQELKFGMDDAFAPNAKVGAGVGKDTGSVTTTMTNLHPDGVDGRSVTGGMTIYDAGGVFASVAGVVRAIYVGAATIGWAAIIPFLVGWLMLSIFLFRRTDKMDAFKKFGIRIVYMAVGIPILGIVYTGMLDSLRDLKVGNNAANASNLVLSTYVDFGSWVNNTRMYIPEQANLMWNTRTDSPAIRSQITVRDTATAINYAANNLYGTAKSLDGLTRTMGQLNNSRDVQSQFRTFQNGFQMTTNAMDKGAQAAQFVSVYNMLQSYFKSEQLSASGFEQAIKSGIEPFLKDRDAKANRLFDDMQNVYGVTTMDPEKVRSHPLLSSGRANQTKDESYFVGNVPNNEPHTVIRFESHPSVGKCQSNVVGTRDDSQPYGIRRADCPMSPLAMYNYLNTTFDSKAGKYFSSSKSVSDNAREQHATVSLVGRGVSAWIYWGSMVITLGSLVLIAFFYAGSILFASFKRTFQLIVAVPFAAIGSIAGIAKVIVYTCGLIIEVIGTIFAYYIFQELLIRLPSAFENNIIRFMAQSAVLSDLGDIFDPKNDGGWFSRITGGVANGVADLDAMLLPISLLVIAIMGIIVLIFTFMALAFRGKFVSAIDEGMTNVINKFLDTSVSSGSEPSQMKNALISAGAMAGTAYAMNGMGDGGGIMDSDGDGHMDMQGANNAMGKVASGVAALGAGAHIVDSAIDAGAEGAAGAGGLGFDGDTSEDPGIVGDDGNPLQVSSADSSTDGVSESYAGINDEGEAIISSGGLTDIPATADEAVAQGAELQDDGTYKLPGGEIVSYGSNGTDLQGADGIQDSALDEASEEAGAAGVAAGSSVVGLAPAGDTAEKDLPSINHAEMHNGVPVGEGHSDEEAVPTKTLGAYKTVDANGNPIGGRGNSLSGHGDGITDSASMADGIRNYGVTDDGQPFMMDADGNLRDLDGNMLDQTQAQSVIDSMNNAAIDTNGDGIINSDDAIGFDTNGDGVVTADDNSVAGSSALFNGRDINGDGTVDAQEAAMTANGETLLNSDSSGRFSMSANQEAGDATEAAAASFNQGGANGIPTEGATAVDHNGEPQSGTAHSQSGEAHDSRMGTPGSDARMAGAAGMAGVFAGSVSQAAAHAAGDAAGGIAGGVADGTTDAVTHGATSATGSAMDGAARVASQAGQTGSSMVGSMPGQSFTERGDMGAHGAGQQGDNQQSVDQHNNYAHGAGQQGQPMPGQSMASGFNDGGEISQPMSAQDPIAGDRHIEGGSMSHPGAEHGGAAADARGTQDSRKTDDHRWRDTGNKVVGAVLGAGAVAAGAVMGNANAANNSLITPGGDGPDGGAPAPQGGGTPVPGQPGGSPQAVPQAASQAAPQAAHGGKSSDPVMRMMQMRVVQQVASSIGKGKNEMNDITSGANKRGKGGGSGNKGQNQPGSGASAMQGIVQGAMMTQMMGGGASGHQPQPPQPDAAKSPLQEQTDSLDRKPGEK